MTFYYCSTCNQVHINLIEQESPMICCEEETKRLESNHNGDDIHTPIIRKIGNFLTVSIHDNHPMMDVHHIRFICLETNQGFQVKYLNHTDDPKSNFILAKDEEIINVYAFL